MATKRMLARSVTDDDRFVSMSASAQALYLHLNMAADDDGFCNQVSICMFRAHAGTDDYETLLNRKYIMQFESGVIVIKHWRMGNAIRKDRYTPTNFKEEYEMLVLDEKGETYHWKADEKPLVADWLPDGCQTVATGKDRLGKVRLGKDSVTVSKDTVCHTQSVRQVIEAWNDAGFAPVMKVTADTNRGKQLRARLNDYGVDAVITAINRAAGSKFLKGQNDRGWQITFDWFLKPNNFIKVMEGNYDDRTSAGSVSASNRTAQMLNDSYDMIARWSEDG